MYTVMKVVKKEVGRMGPRFLGGGGENGVYLASCMDYLVLCDELERKT